MPTLEAVKQLKESISKSSKTSTMQEVEFTLHAPDVKKVCISGQFNDWNTQSMPMKKSKDGTWRVKMKLPRGKYEYKYFVDGAWARTYPVPK
jgi:1,4-alpha-glucan branching enzyme